MERKIEIESEIKEVINEVLEDLGLDGVVCEKYFEDYNTWEYEVEHIDLQSVVKTSYGTQLSIDINYKYNLLKIRVQDYPYETETCINLYKYTKINFKEFVNKIINNYIDVMNFVAGEQI